MAFPASTSILVRGALQNVSILYRNQSYIADSIFPLINGLNYQTKVLKYAKRDWFGLTENGFRAENATAARVDYKVTTQNLDPREISFGATVSDELFFASNQPGNLPVQPITDCILLVSDKIDRFREKLVADTIYGTDLYKGTVTWSDGTTGGSLPSAGAGGWAVDSSANSIIKDVENAKAKVLKNTGVIPNSLMMDYNTFVKCFKIPGSFLGGIIDRIKYTQRAEPGDIGEGLVAAALGLDNVVVGKAIYTSERETAAGTMTNPAFIWDPNSQGKAFLYYRPAAAGLKQVSPGYQYRVAYDGQTWRRLISYREEWAHHSVYEAAEWVDIAPVSTDVGYLFNRTYA
jgi:hypothetical protein